jgi:predicted anti-sigma-YlaC factor YlaD
MKTAHAMMHDLMQRQLDGDQISDNEQRALSAHLATCSDCRSFQHDLGRIMGLVEEMPLVKAPDGFVGTVMAQIPAPEAQTGAMPAWLHRLVSAWAPALAVVGFLILMSHAFAMHGVTLLNLPAAIGEWAAMIDLTDLSSVSKAVSLFASNTAPEMLLGVSLVVVALFGMMVQALSKPPVTHMPARHHAGVS